MLSALLDTNVILSGLFFKGNERRLLMAVLEGRLKAIIPEDVVLECVAIIGRKFSDEIELDLALELFETILSRSKLISADSYRSKVPYALTLIDDTKDSPVLAAFLVAKSDLLVTGDKDFKRARGIDQDKVVYAKRVLELI